MPDIDVIFIIEMVGIVAYAISGAMVAINEKMDLFGVVALGVTTACGGGLVRDIIIGQIPPVVFSRPVYAITALIVSLIVFIPAVYKRINEDSKILWFMDALGLGAFAVVGVRASMQVSPNIFMATFTGLCTGVGGGLLRDIFAGKRSMIFTKHFYAVPTLAGSLACALLWRYGEIIAITVGGLLVVVLRVLAIIFKWHLPKVK